MLRTAPKTLKSRLPLLAALLLPAAPRAAHAEVRDVTAREAADILSRRDDVIILDVRTPAEYDEGHLAGARLLPVTDPDFEQRLDALDRDATYLVHCRSGSRSRRAVDAMRKMGFRNILHMSGGILEWNREGLPLGKDEGDVPTNVRPPDMQGVPGGW